MAYLELDRISFSYGKLKVLDELSFSVGECEIFGLLGPNGSGKSTCLQILSGLLKPKSGNIIFNGNCIRPHKKCISRIMGYCPQESSIFNALTVKENLKYFANLYKIKGNLNAIVNETVSSVNLQDKANTLARNLSGGMKRRLTIGCSLLHNPKILLLDEPTIELDPVSRNEIWKLIIRINRSGTTVIIATNLMSDALNLCKKAVYMESGRKILEGPAPDVMKTIMREG